MAAFSQGAREARFCVTRSRTGGSTTSRWCVGATSSFWFDEDVIDAWEHDNAAWKVGRPFTYSDVAVETLLTLRELFRLPYRQTEGLGRSLATLMNAEHRDSRLHVAAEASGEDERVQINVRDAARQPIHVVVDSTGVKVYRRRGVEGPLAPPWNGVATWRKLHLAVDPQTQEIVAQVLTSSNTGDAGQVEPLLDQVQQPVEKLYGDGGYDHWHVYHALAKRGIAPIISLRKNASIRQHGGAAQKRVQRGCAL